VLESGKIPKKEACNCMKKARLIQILNEMGVVFVRHGKKHDVYIQPATKIETTIPRHDEIKDFTAKSIIKTLSPIEKNNFALNSNSSPLPI
jgi:predicted RNA binding protein YcfA (HicA-like mRNA interferase family)